MRTQRPPDVRVPWPGLAHSLPESVLRRVVARSVAGANIALCLHRVGRPRPRHAFPELFIAPEKIDRLIEILGGTGAGAPARLTLTFDDGYADAAAYVASRAPHHRGVEWLVFVPPEKIERRSGYRWDLDVLERPEATQIDLDSDLDRARENERPDLGRLADHPACALATAESLRAIARIDGVQLGNHTNTHFRLTRLRLGDAVAELERSTRDFERLFGRCLHFAFPYGHPGRDYSTDHLEALRALGLTTIWTTEHRPYRAEERERRRPLPRFPIDGRWSAEAIALWIAAVSERSRLSSLSPRGSFAPAG